jgi:hypothetical protein
LSNGLSKRKDTLPDFADMISEKRITAERAMEILHKNGMEVTLQEAILILEFLYKMAKLEVKEALKR